MLFSKVILRNTVFIPLQAYVYDVIFYIYLTVEPFFKNDYQKNIYLQMSQNFKTLDLIAIEGLFLKY